MGDWKALLRQCAIPKPASWYALDPREFVPLAQPCHWPAIFPLACFQIRQSVHHLYPPEMHCVPKDIRDDKRIRDRRLVERIERQLLIALVYKLIQAIGFNRISK